MMKIPILTAIITVLYLSSPCLALTISEGTILNPNSSASGHYVVSNDFTMDNITLNGTHIIIQGLASDYQECWNENTSTLIFNASFGDILYTDTVEYLKFNSSGTAVPGGGGGGTQTGECYYDTDCPERYVCNSGWCERLECAAYEIYSEDGHSCIMPVLYMFNDYVEIILKAITGKSPGEMVIYDWIKVALVILAIILVIFLIIYFVNF